MGISRRDFLKLAGAVGLAWGIAPYARAADALTGREKAAEISSDDLTYLEGKEDSYLQGIFSLTHNAAMSLSPTHLPIDFAEVDYRGAVRPKRHPSGYLDLKTTPSNVGFRLLSIMALYDKLKDKKDPESQAKKKALLDTIFAVLKFLEKAKTERGFYYRYYSLSSGRLTPEGVPGHDPKSEISSIDNANLTAGMLAAAAFFKKSHPDLSGRFMKIVEKQDYSEFLDEKTAKLKHGFRITWGEKYFLQYNYDIFFTEARLLNFIALMLNKDPEKKKLLERAWMNQGLWPAKVPVEGGDVPVFRNHGGSLFEFLHSSIVLDEERHGSPLIGKTLRNAIRIQQSEATDGFWGRSPAYNHRGVYEDSGSRLMGNPGYSSAHITPYSWGLAAPFALAATFVLSYMLLVVNFFAFLPFAEIKFSIHSVYILLCIYTLYGLLAYWLLRKVKQHAGIEKIEG